MKTILTLLLFATSLMTTFTSHQALAASDSTVSEEETLDVPKARKFVYLTIGIDYEEKIAGAPEVVTFGGDYKKLGITEASYIKSTNTVHFDPKKEGVGTLTLFDKHKKKIAEFRIIVHKSKLDAVARELQSLLGEVEGITIKIINNKVLVDGQVLLPSDMARIISVLDQFGDQAASLVTMSPLAMKKISEFIARDINNPEIEVKAMNDKIILTGWANSPAERDNADAIARSYMPPVVADSKSVEEKIKRRKVANDGVVNRIEVKQQPAPPPSKMIQVVLHYVELNKDYTKGFRFQFMPSLADSSGVTVTAGDSGSNAGTQFTATINSLLPKLNWAKSHGHARVLESGSILAKDGASATFSSMTVLGSSSAVTASGQQVQTSGGQQFGMNTTVTPTILGERSDSVNLNLNITVSAPAGATNGQANIATNKMTTELIVRSTQSAAIGGLITNASITGYNKLPAGVSDNPILSIYASKDFSHNQSQFVIFATPIIRSSASVGAEKVKKKFRLRD